MDFIKMYSDRRIFINKLRLELIKLNVENIPTNEAQMFCFIIPLTNNINLSISNPLDTVVGTIETAMAGNDNAFIKTNGYEHTVCRFLNIQELVKEINRLRLILNL